ncbi:MAG TPA: FAD-dependent monooxygenase [Ktedonobacteraceae bacterium]|nr:FAD-dependent monooxygenase [Ktedonobacteraceae bacterium]
MDNNFVPVVIIGAGPTGLTAANLLGQYGIETLLVERNSALSDLPRAITIDDEGLRICQAAGVRDEVLGHVLLDVGAQYFSHGRLLMRLMPGSLRNGYPLISTFNQPRLEAILLAGLRRFVKVEVLFGHSLDAFTQREQQVEISLRTPTGGLRQITCAYLLACDGGKGPVRRILGIPMKGITFPQRWLILDGLVGEDSSPGRYVTCYYDSNRPAVSIPAPDQHWRWEFMLRPEEDVYVLGETQSNVPADYLRRLLLQVGDRREPHVVRQTVYTFHASYATSFAHNRIFLLGDAAHLLPPFGGQGMNSGLRDAHNLAWKLAFVLRGQAQPRVLATYQQERLPHVVQMIRFARFLGNHLVMPTGRLRAFFRDIALRALTRLPPFVSSMRQMRMKPEPVYKSGLVWPDNHGYRRPTGRLLPQPTVLLSGKRLVPLDEVLGSGFALLRLHSDPNVAFKTLQADIWQKLRPRRICLVPTIEHMQDTCENVVCAFDNQQQIAHFLRGRLDHLALIRPDRHVLGTFGADQEQAFVEPLRERFFCMNEGNAVHAGRQ